MTTSEATSVEQACAVLEHGGVVAVPTETVYGLAASIRRPEAVRRLFELKGRPLFDPLIVHIGDESQLADLARDVPPVLLRLARHFWPGPLTIIVPKLPSVDPLITAGLDSVGIRLPRHPIARAIAHRVPFAGPSANKFTRVSPTAAQHVRDEFPGEDLLVVDGGDCEHGLESTVIDAAEGQVRVLRPGIITAEELARVAGVSVLAASAPTAPGQMKEHYRPAIPLLILANGATIGPSALRKISISGDRGVELVLGADPLSLARRLYADLRKLSASGGDYIFVRRDAGMSGAQWDAIWNRLERAAVAQLTG